MNLEKTIPVKTDDLKKAIEKAQEIFEEEELTAEWLDARNITFEEDEMILDIAKCLAHFMYTMYGSNITMDSVKSDIENIFKPSETSDFIFDETIKILNEKYDLELSKIKI